MELFKIKNRLIKACKRQKASIFLLALFSKRVKVPYPTKLKFYRFFCYMLKCSKKDSMGQLRLEIINDNSESGSNLDYYNFYDEMHNAPRLTLTVKEDKDHLELDILPF